MQKKNETNQGSRQPRGDWASVLRGAGTEGPKVAPATVEPTAPQCSMAREQGDAYLGVDAQSSPNAFKQPASWRQSEECRILAVPLHVPIGSHDPYYCVGWPPGPHLLNWVPVEKHWEQAWPSPCTRLALGSGLGPRFRLEHVLTRYSARDRIVDTCICGEKQKMYIKASSCADKAGTARRVPA